MIVGASKTRPWRVARSFVFVCLLGMWFALTGNLCAQDEPKKIVAKFGTEAFQKLLSQYALRALPAIDNLTKVPANETLIVVLGENAVLDKIRRATGGLDKFLSSGGALLVASDFGSGRRLEEIGIRIDGQIVREHPRTAFLQRSRCPMIQQFDHNHPLFRGVARGLATNEPSFIRVQPGRHAGLALFSANCSALGRRVWNRPYIVGSPSNALPGGRVLVIAGHGVFFNLMMHYVQDADNMEFAKACAKWLSESPMKPKFPAKVRYRKYLLFVERGRVVQKLAQQLSIPPMPLDAMLHRLNPLLRGLEEEDFFNRILFENVRPFRIWQLVALAFTLWLLIWCARHLIKCRALHDKAVPRLAEGIAGYPRFAKREEWAKSPVPVRKQKQQLRRGNYWETAYQLARHFFFDLANLQIIGDADTSRLAVEGTPKQRRQIEILWRLASGTDPQPVSARKLRLYIKQMDEFAQRIADRTLVVTLAQQ